MIKKGDIIFLLQYDWCKTKRKMHKFIHTRYGGNILLYIMRRELLASRLIAIS